VTDIETDGSGTAYLGAYNSNGGPVRFEGRLAVDIANGSAKWWDGCYGDTQAVTLANGVLYSASHTHACPPIGIPSSIPGTYLRLLAETPDATATSPVNFNNVKVGDPVPTLLPWLPNTNGGPTSSVWKNGTWSLASTSDYIVVGGEFTQVNGQPQQSLTRFAARTVAGAVNNGPQYPFPAPTVTRDAAGKVTVQWHTTWDAQNWNITYKVNRVGTAQPVYSVTQASQKWDLPTLSWTDPDAPTSGHVEYWITAVDADGAHIGSPHGSVG
jgi:hypothetical protein